MVPAALVILGMISVLPLPLVVRLWDDLGESRQKPNRIKCDADKLLLFLAKKDGAWLDGVGAAAVALDGDGHLQGFEQMDPTLFINNFGKNFGPAEGEVHVLVVVPEGAVGSASETSKLDKLVEKVDKMNDKLDKTMLGKRKVRHSSASSSLLDNLHVRLRASRAVPFEPEKHVEPFMWGCIVDERGQKIKLTEEQQRERYREYVKVNIGDTLAKNKLCVYGVDKGEGAEDILSADVPGHDIKLAGRTDMIILSDQVLENRLELEMLPDVRLIIEVKQKVERRSISQAVSELIALDIMAAEPVMALLTDLQKHWQFFWVADPTNNRGTIESVTICDPSKAFAVIKTLLASAGAGAVVSLPCFQEPIKRRKISGVLASIGEGGGTGIRESIDDTMTSPVC
ncbi:hypothetical protein PR003_g3714 [Phytophthora rubi]|uniref:Crinkler effector protein N-terminal domain-containing protein n=1 Tax=Phytophthora rubi TaxID=129364 RepID=A0A6A4G684_9STRA|nr:hypothetical protein PR003_g3714 [Phytophthora rubi]